MARKVPLTEVERNNNAAWGAQDLLVIAAVPDAESHALIGQKLLGQTLAVTGTYYCLIPLSGLVTSLQSHIKATFASGTVAVAGPDSLYYLQDFYSPSNWSPKVAGTGDGALTTTVLLTSTLTGFTGEQYALVTIAISGGASALFTVAEYNGI